MKVRARMRSHDGVDAEVRVMDYRASDYVDAYAQAEDTLPDGWVLVRVDVIE